MVSITSMFLILFTDLKSLTLTNNKFTRSRKNSCTAKKKKTGIAFMLYLFASLNSPRIIAENPRERPHVGQAL